MIKNHPQIIYCKILYIIALIVNVKTKTLKSKEATVATILAAYDEVKARSYIAFMQLNLSSTFAST